MNKRYGPGPSGVNPSRFQSSSVIARSASRRRCGDRAELVEHFLARRARGSPRSTARWPCRCRCARAAHRRPAAASGCSPSNMRSVPIMCATLSCTDQPGQSVGRAHCSSVRSVAQRDDVAPHVLEQRQPAARSCADDIRASARSPPRRIRVSGERRRLPVDGARSRAWHPGRSRPLRAARHRR